MSKTKIERLLNIENLLCLAVETTREIDHATDPREKALNHARNQTVQARVAEAARLLRHEISAELRTKGQR